MKMKLSILGLLLALGVLFVSCSKDKDSDSGKVINNREQALLNKYPNASAISWKKSKDNKYDIATFNLPKGTRAGNGVANVSAWFAPNDATMCLVDQEITFEELPVAVQDKFATLKSAFNQELYSNTAFWMLDDVCKLERDGVVSYKIEVEGVQAEIEVDLYFDEQGILLKEVEDIDTQDDEDGEEETPLEIPENVANWITANYPNAEILDYEMEEENGVRVHELDLKEQNIIIEVTLTEGAEGLTAEIENYYPNVEALPQDILEKLKEAIAKQTLFVLADVDEIEMITINGDEIYTIEFENETAEGEVDITKKSDGTYVIGDFEIDTEDEEENEDEEEEEDENEN
ncbi:MAG: PepSY-like domain-containing protein [Alistipes sp.]